MDEMPENRKNEAALSYESTIRELQGFMDVPLKVTVQLGERRMKVLDILRLQSGSVIDLPKSAGENVDILINGKLVAFGEVMELESSTGIRITDLNTPA
ncbi:MAG: flagellar motor switch protein FliN [Acidobacteriota bacterium]|jgi:flagellar motor switch protein FliN/FliY|nr:flagellar motor switch protein FliN [Acidobacteriota bacterium]